MVDAFARFILLWSVLVGVFAVALRLYLGPGWSAKDMGDLSGKVALVTGANSGLGLQTARLLARSGCRVVMACRSAQRCDAAAQSIIRDSRRAKVETMVVDLSEPESVETFSKSVLQEVSQLDFLFNNAGVMGLPESRNSAGWELQIATNHLGHFLLVHHLMPLLERSRTRIVNHASSMAHVVWPIQPVNLTDLTYQRGRRYQPWIAYAQTKRANLWFTHELNRRLGEKGITATSCHPGFSDTALQGKADGTYFPKVSDFVNVLAMSAANGALPQLYAAVKAEPDQFIGPHFLLWGPPTVAGTSLSVFPFPADDPMEAARLWDVSEEVTGLRAPAPLP
eukprot:GGOE01001395.1.p1 GENE.GGOE01001395.1~~GGOE01001395.1.p1  ORF type:complete len:338 (-),score=82.98 GGOE01001395.1:321-1334(-)